MYRHQSTPIHPPPPQHMTYPTTLERGVMSLALLHLSSLVVIRSVQVEHGVWVGKTDGGRETIARKLCNRREHVLAEAKRIERFLGGRDVYVHARMSMRALDALLCVLSGARSVLQP